MRKINKRIEQKGTGKKVKKSAYELLTELTREDTKKFKDKYQRKTKKKVTKKTVAKKLGISERTLRSYKQYLLSEQLKGKVKKNKNSRKPPAKFYEKLKKISKNTKVKLTRDSSNVFLRTEERRFKELLSDSVYKKLKVEIDSEDFFNILVRINVLFYTKQGTFSDWVTLVIPAGITSKGEINKFISGELGKKIRAKNSILAFEIVETIFETIIDDYEEKPKKSKNPKQIRSGKGFRKNKK